MFLRDVEKNSKLNTDDKGMEMKQKSQNEIKIRQFKKNEKFIKLDSWCE